MSSELIERLCPTTESRNDEQTLPALLAKLADVLRETSYEIILVEDSDDATAQVAPQLSNTA